MKHSAIVKTVFAKEIFLLLLFITRFLSTGYSQTYSITLDNSSLTGCGAGTNLWLNFSNTGTTQVAGSSYVLTLPQGVNFTSTPAFTPSSTTITYTGPSSFTPSGSFSFTLGSMPASSTAKLKFPIVAGCNRSTWGQITTPFTLAKGTNPAQQLGPSLTITAPNTYLSYQSTQIYKKGDQAPPVTTTVKSYETTSGSYLTREYILKNTSTSVFDGYVSFYNVADVQPKKVIYIQSVEINQVNGSTKASTPLISPKNNPTPPVSDKNDNTFIIGSSNAMQVHVTVAAGDEIHIRENLYIYGCLRLAGDANSNESGHTLSPMIQWGCNLYDLCNTRNTEDTQIFKGTTINALNIASDLTNTASDFVCYGSGTSHTRSVTWRNDGNEMADSARFMLFYGGTQQLLIPNQTVNVTIQRASGASTSYTVDPTNNAPPFDLTTNYLPTDPVIKSWLDPNDYATYFQGNGAGGWNPRTGGFILNATFNQSKYQSKFNYIVSPLQLRNTTYEGDRPDAASFSCLANGENTKLIYKLVIEKLKDVNSGTYSIIQLFPGDWITINWQETNCCFMIENPESRIRKPYLGVEYRNGCGDHLNGQSVPTEEALVAGSLNPAPGAVIIEGNPDWCNNTSDGRVDSVTARLNDITVNLPAAYNNLSGNLRFWIYFDKGLDLDLSLSPEVASHTLANYGFDNLDNSKTGCHQACSTCTLKTLNNPIYSVDLMLSDGVTPIPLSGLVKPSLVINKTFPAPDDNNPSLTVNRTAENVYEIVVPLTTISNGPNGSVTDLLNKLKGATFSMKMRAYCTSQIYSHYKVALMLDKCASATPSGCPNPGTTPYIPISFFNGSRQVVCPGCQVPGSNVNSVTMNRSIDDMGYVDISDDGIADGSTKIQRSALVTNGDELVSTLVVSISDGSGTTQLSNFTSHQYYLDNLYIRYNLPAPFVGGMSAIRAEATIPGSKELDDPTLVWHSVNLDKNGNFVSVKASDLGVAHLMDSNIPVAVRITYLLNLQNANNVIVPSGMYDITYETGYSMCTGCSFNALGYIDPSGASFPSDILVDTGKNPNYLFKCTDGSGQFGYIQWETRSYVDMDNFKDLDLCIKPLVFNNLGNFKDHTGTESTNAFPGEYRCFMDLKNPMLFKSTFPTGYTVGKIVIYNLNVGEKNTITETQVIDDPAILKTFIKQGLGAGTTFSNTFNFSVNFREISQTEADAQLPFANGAALLDYTKNDLTQRFIVRDEHFNISVKVDLVPDGNGDLIPDDDCQHLPSSLSLSTEWTNKKFSSKTNIYNYTNNTAFATNPHTIGNLGNDDATPDYNRLQSNILINKPSLTLQAANVLGYSQITVSSPQIQIPFNIVNSTSYFADFPFVQISGTALTKGIQVTGVKIGQTVFQPIVTDNSNLFGNGLIIGVGSDVNTPRIAPGGTLQCTLILNYTCTSCNLDLGCGTGQQLDPLRCLVNDDLTINYGWNCTSYPNSFAALDRACNRSTSTDALHYTLNVNGLGITGSVGINGGALSTTPVSATVSNCTNIQYKARILSCRLGGKVNTFSLDFGALPAGLTYTGFTVSDNSFTVSQGSSPSVYNISSSGSGIDNGAYVDVTLTFAASCAFTKGDLSAKLTAKTFCNQDVPVILPTASVSVAITSSQLENIQNVSASYSADHTKLLISYTTTAPLAKSNNFIVNLAQGLTQQTTGSTTVTYAIPKSQPAGTYTATINLNISAVTCSKSYTSTVVLSRPYTQTCNSTSCSTTVNESPVTAIFNTTACGVDFTPLTACMGVPVQFTGTFSGNATSWTWSFPGATTSAQAGSSATATYPSAGTYNVTLTVNDGISTGTITKPVTVYSNPAVTASVDKAQICFGQSAVLSATPASASYSWSSSDGFSATAGAPVTVTPKHSTIYTLTAANAGCSVTQNVSVIVNPIPDVTITTADGEGSFLIPTCHEQITLKADAGYASYQWFKDNSSLGQGASNLTINYNASASQAGWYRVEAIDNNGCKGSSSVQVYDKLTISGDDAICPGETTNLFLKIDGVTGSFLTQWFQDNEKTDAPSGAAGHYNAIVLLTNIVPACTLSTTQDFIVNLKPTPALYTISVSGNACSGNNINLCPGDPAVTLTATAPASSSPAIRSAAWSTGVNTLTTTTITTNTAGVYYVTAVGDNNCASESNKIVIIAPMVSISQKCLNDQSQSTLLTALANIPNVQVSWQGPNNTSLGTAPSITVTSDGLYTVSTTNLRCNVTATTQVCRATDNTTGSNMITNGNFDITGVSDPCVTPNPLGFTSSVPCTNTNPASWPGHYIITNDASGYNRLSGNFQQWIGTGYLKPGSSDKYFLAVDGAITATSDKVWSKTVTVQKCVTYNFSALVNNIDVNTIKPAEVPKVSLKIGGYEIRRQTLFENQAAWNQLGGTWKSDIDGDVELSIVLQGGGWVGRDIGIDEVTFNRVSCGTENTGGRPCNAVATVGLSQLYVVPGCPITIGNNTTVPGLTYTWTSDDKTFTSSVPNPTVAPVKNTTYTLLVFDPINGCSSTDKVSVSMITPTVCITSSKPDNCSIAFTTNSFSGVANAQYKWYVNGVAVVTNTTGTFTPTNVKQGDKVKCQLILSCGPSPFSNEITITDVLGPVISPTASPATICPGNSSTLSVSVTAGTTPYTYKWMKGTTTVATTQSVSVAPTSTTSYTVQVTDGKACSVTSTPLTVTISSSPISTGTVNTSLCAGSSVTVPYTIYCPVFNTGNVFTAQLSNSSGSFSSPVNIGTVSSTTSGVITAVIPATTAGGSGYRIRVVSSNTVNTGSDNGVNITINALPSGATFGTAINIGTLSGCMMYSDVKNNSTNNCYLNNFGQPSDDIYYKFTLAAAATVDITHAGSGLADTYMSLLNSSGTLLQDNDDYGTVSPNTQQSSIRASLAAGTYYIVSEGFGGNSGNIKTQVLLTSANFAGTSTLNPINIGALGNCTIYTDTKNNSTANCFRNDYGNPSDDIYYSFTVTQNTVINISTCSSGMDTYLYLLDKDGNLLTSNDDEGPLCESTQASISRSIGPGVYYIVCEGYDTNTGDIITTVYQSSAKPAGATLYNPINIGTLSSCSNYTNTVSNDPSNCYANNYGQDSDDIYYRFSLSSPATVTVSSCGSPNNFDTFLYLLNEEGTLLNYNDDAAQSPQCYVQSYFTQPVPAGTYYVIAEGYDDNSGPITTSIQVSCPAGSSRTGSSIDLSGASSSTNLVENKTIRLSPNPATETFTVYAPSDNIVKISVMDLIGRVVKEVTTESDNTVLNVADLSSALYLVQVIDGDKLTILRLDVVK